LGGTGTDQHTVPQTYLKRFAKNNHVAVYNKELSDFLKKTKSIKSRPSEKGFYDTIDGDGKQTDAIDKALDKILDPTGKLLEKIDKFCNDAKNHGNSAVLSAAEKEQLVCYLTLQLLKTFKARSIAENFTNTINAQLAELAERNSKTITTDLPDGKSVHLAQLMDGRQLSDYAHFLFDAVWVFVYNNTNVSLITSDSPVFRIVTRNTHTGGDIFFDEDNEICFPISRKVILRIVKSGVKWFEEHKGYNNKIMVKNDPQYFETVNTCCFVRANNEIYYHPDDCKALVNKCLELTAGYPEKTLQALKASY